LISRASSILSDVVRCCIRTEIQNPERAASALGPYAVLLTEMPVLEIVVAEYICPLVPWISYLPAPVMGMDTPLFVLALHAVKNTLPKFGVWTS
jgi:hypothetical protein